MKDRFEERLDRCLEAVLSGRWTVEDCLLRYPQDATRLRPLLLAALRLREALASEPRPEFREAARERFLVATGQRLREALAVEPRPSFVEAARQRFLLAARRMLAAREGRRWSLPRPVLPTPGAAWLRVPAPVAAAAAVALVSFFAFSTYAVATSGDALPGEWQYPIKRATERARLALAFSDDSRRDVRLDIAWERLWEVEALASRGHPIGEAELGRMTGETASLVEDIDTTSWKVEDVRRVSELAERQETVLAQVEPLVKPEARQVLEEAETVSREAKERVIQALAVLEAPKGEPAGVLPGEPTATAEPEGTATAEATASATPSPTEPTGEEGAAPAPTATPTPTPVPPLEPVPGRVVRGPAPDDHTAGLEWMQLVVDRLSLRVPSASAGWFLAGLQFGRDDTASAPSLLRLMNISGTSIVVVETDSGDVWWYVFDGQLFQEVTLRRLLPDGGVEIVDASSLRSVYPGQAEIILHLLESIDLAPPTPTPTATPEATSTPVAAPTGEAAGW